MVPPVRPAAPGEAVALQRPREEESMHGRIARYRISGDPHELARRAEEGMLPIFEAQPGFKAYILTISGDTLTSMSAWATIEQAEAATPAAAKWIAENIAEDIELI